MRRSHTKFLLSFIVGIFLFSILGCQSVRAAAGEYSTDCSQITGSGQYECKIPGYPRRPYLAFVPSGYSSDRNYPVVIGFHGGGGNAQIGLEYTCEDGDIAAGNCLHAVADRYGYILIMPNGSSRLWLPNVRTFNAGGGNHRWMCVSGYACRQGIDDFQFFLDLMDDIERRFSIDSSRVYLTGMSNGAALSHAIACRYPDRVRAIAVVAGGNQFSVDHACNRAVAVLQIHGTSDPCWPYNGGTQTCVNDPGKMKSIPGTINAWRVQNGCAFKFKSIAMPDHDPNDGTTSVRRIYKRCSATLEHIRVEGGGHHWPGGKAHSAPARVGPYIYDFSGSEMVLEFFDRER